MSQAGSVAHLEGRVKRALAEAGLDRGCRLVVAVSGGPDSLALLFSLHHLSRELGLELHGAHLDHGLRGSAGAADARFVGEVFERLRLELTSERADVRSHRKTHRLSLEEAARDVRYAFLGRLGRELDADAVALGHTSDDQSETVLMHIVRGSGLTGLRGMSARSSRRLAGEKTVLVRPLLQVSRSETVEYCDALDLEPRTDESNRSPEMTRNRVRMELLPLLRELNPAVGQALLRLSSSAATDLDFIERQADAVWDTAVSKEGELVALKRDAVAGLHPSLQAHLLRRAAACLGGGHDELEEPHIRAMTHLLRGPAGRSLDLPGGVRFAVDYDRATIARATPASPVPRLDGRHAVAVPGETISDGWRIETTLLESDSARNRLPARRPEAREMEYAPDGLTAYLSAVAVRDHLHLRTRSAGDLFQPLGMAGHKKLQDFMIDARVPRRWRDSIPLLVASRGIAWVVGWRIADWARVTETERRVLEVRLLPTTPTSPDQGGD